MANSRVLRAQEKLVRALGARVRRRREELGWTQRQLAAEAGFAHGIIGRLETDFQQGVTPLTLYRLAAALDTRMEDLMGLPPL